MYKIFATNEQYNDLTIIKDVTKRIILNVNDDEADHILENIKILKEEAVKKEDKSKVIKDTLYGKQFN